MLREHGSQRPTVFEVLNLVHRMRGTKSKFAYNVPSRSQLVPQLATEPASTTAGALDGLVSYRSSTSSVSQAQLPPSSNKNAGVQAREKVLEAIAPLRRGRPTTISLHHATTGPSSPTQEKLERKQTELEFNDAEDESWKAARGAVRGHRSGLMSPTKWPVPAASYDDAWSVARGSSTDAEKAKNRDRRKTVLGSQGDLSGFGDSFGGGLEFPSATVKSTTSTSGTPWLTPQLSVKPPETTSRIRVPNKPKDAFEGLGLLSDRAPAPTLGEVQKARTGASVGATGVESSNLAVPGRGTSHSASNSPRPSPSPRLSSQGPSPAPAVSTSWRPLPSPRPQAPSSAPKVDLSVEHRFPALEDLDSSLLSSSSTARPPPHTQPLSQKMSPLMTSPALPPQSSSSAFTGTSNQPSGRKFAQGLSRGGGVHSEQTTGTALESREVRTPKHERTGSHLPTLSPSRIPRLPSRAMPPRRQSSLTVLRPPSASKGLKPNEPPSPAQIMGRPEPQDWLTGPEDDPMSGSPTKAVLKESPGKRASVIVERAPYIQSPQEAVAISEKRASPPPSPTPAPRTTSSWIMAIKQANVDTGGGWPPVQPEPRLDSSKPRVSAPPPADSWLPTHRRRDTTSTTSSEDGPEDATGYAPPRLTATRMPMLVEAKQTGGADRRRRSKSKSRQSSVHELVDLWGGKEGRTKPSGGGKGTPTVSKAMSQEPEDISSLSKPLLFPPTGQSSKSRSASPSPLISPSISNDSTRPDLSTSTQSSSRHRKQSTNGRDAGPPPSVSAGSATARPRPQSMFLNSPTTAAVKFPAPSPIDSSSTSLEVPSPDPRSQRTRRTSISNMVQRFEAMGTGSAAASPDSRQPNSPAQPGVSLTRSATTHVSPSPRRGHLGAVGLPGLATDSSKKPPTGLGMLDKPRAEHASPVGLPGLAMERKPSASYGSGRRSPVKPDATTGGGGGLDIPVRPAPIRAASPVNAPAGEEASTATAERPYHGVGRLIDEWQRKTADAEAPRSPVSRRRGGGGVGGAGTGATASPRRAGVIAGRGAQD